ncbi:uncharacterized protein LOC110987377 [Paramuricea clavata]|uniref:Uncharacterized protein LOC110987377 n=1 Tax=Paramuricea clavata TaxID=317549 RepID=A0A7D9DG72_PARCT|nr:uncharacterized protein LOC110987377 [Paramuricea clavata]
MASSLPPFPPFNVEDDPTATGQRWTKWKKRFENFLLAMDIDDETRKRALLLHYIGSSAFDIFETLTDTGDEKDYKKAMDRLTEHFTPQRNVDYEIYLFRQARQQPTETLDQFTTRLRQLASTCEFTSIEKEIKSQIILNCSSSHLRRRALRDSPLTLKALLDLGRAMEISEKQASQSGIESQSISPDETELLNYTRLSQRSQSRQSPSPPFPRSREFPSPSCTCGHCGYAYPHPQGQVSCPARGSQCRSCGKMKHFARCCRSKPIRPTFAESSSSRPQSRFQPPPPNSFPRQPPPREIRHVTDTQQYPTSDDEYLFTVAISQVGNSTTPKAKVMIANVPLQMLIDSGASINVIDEKAYHAITKSPQNNPLSLRHTSTKIYSYGGTSPLPVLGTFYTRVESKTRTTPATIYVIKGENGCLLSYKTATELELISVIAQTNASVNTTTPLSALSSHTITF